MENKKLLSAKVTCSNDIIEAGYRLTLMETRLLQACIAQIDSTKELRVTDRFELSAKDFAKLYKISEESAYDELKAVSKQLFSRHIVINNPDPEHPKIKQTRTQWITSIDYLPDEGKLYLFFAPKILPYLSQLKGKFTQYELKNIGNMKSTYGIRLYLLMMQWKTTGTRTIEIDWLKKQLELDEGYSAMCDFKKRVIDPAVNDMNKNSDYTVSWEQSKTGRRVTHLIFTFSEKLPEKPLAKPVTKKRPTKKELEQQRLAEQLKVEQQQKAELDRQQYRERKRQSLINDLSIQFSRQARENFIASMDEQAQQQLVADILEEAQQFDKYLVVNIKKKGLNCIPAYFLITKRIPNFAERKAAFIAEQLTLNDF
jgi:plasmid replication initiation protein